MRWIGVAVLLLLGAGMVCAQDTQPAGVTPEDAKAGFVSLFDGKSLDGWQGDVKHYAVEDGVLVCHGAKLCAAKQYANFILRFDFKLPPAGNNGIGIRAPLGGDTAYMGIEIQILDDGHLKYKNLLPYQAHGSIYGVVPAKRGSLKPIGQWNREEIVADGSHIKVTVNGMVVTAADIGKLAQTVDGKPHPGLHNAKGYIGLLGHNADPVAFRNIRIKELP